MTPRLVCARCGLRVIVWRDGCYKHAANWHRRGCGKPPVPVEAWEDE